MTDVVTALPLDPPAVPAEPAPAPAPPPPPPTFTSARWADAAHRVAQCVTAEIGSVMVTPEQGELWAAMQEAVAGGLAIADFVPLPPPVPDQVTNYQARAALIAAGLFEQVDNAVKAQGATSAAYQAWEYANNVYRGSPLIAGLGQALGLSGEQIDNLFRAAADIDA